MHESRHAARVLLKFARMEGVDHGGARPCLPPSGEVEAYGVFAPTGTWLDAGKADVVRVRPRRSTLSLVLGITMLLAPTPGRGVALDPGDAVDPPQPPAAVLYLFAHQDDEYFILARMAREVAAGRAVHAAWITDGARRGSSARRNAESIAVMARLGIPPARLHFLAFPDQDAVSHLAQIHAQVRALDAQHRFVAITTPAYEGGNIDHDVAALIGALLVAEAQERLEHFEFPLYHHHDGRGRVGVFLPHPEATVEYTRLDPGDRVLLRQALWTYRSQRWLLLGLRLRSDRKTLREHGEPFRRAPAYDFLARPSHELCGYEVVRRRRAPFDRWLEAVRPFLDQVEFQRG